MPVVVTFGFETEADAVAVVKELEADERVLATEIRLADGRTLGFGSPRRAVRKSASRRFEPFAKPSANGRCLREGDGWSRR
jgi:hypothetical protein